MKNLLRLLAASFLLALAATVFGQLPIGTIRKPITTDGTNAFDPPYIVFTNRVGFTKNISLNGFTNSDGGFFQSGDVTVGTNGSSGTFNLNVNTVSTKTIMTTTNISAQSGTLSTNLGQATGIVRNSDLPAWGATGSVAYASVAGLSTNTVNPSPLSLTNGYAGARLTGLTNTGGFFLGGNGTIGTNGSASILTINASPVVSGSMTVSNVALTYPQWVDTPVSYAYSAVGPSAPTLVSVSGSSPIQLLGFNNSTLLYGLAQWPHNIAVTNATTPVLYYEPHVHFSVVNQPAAGATNVTWRLIWQYGEIGIPYGTRCFTNTVTMSITTSNVQYLAEFGHFTNNTMGITGIFRCRLDRPASAVGDYDSAATVLLNGFDIHVPIANFTISGSRQDAAQ